MIKLKNKEIIDIERIQNEKKYFSFDIFDTLITRRTATPLGIFAIMQEKLKIDLKYSSFSEYFKNNFAILRHNTECWKRDNVLMNCSNVQDITFDEIYEAIQLNQNLKNEQIQLLKELEIETEKNNLVAIEENIKILKDLKKVGKDVFLISDMYFSKDVIRYFLVDIDPIFKDVEIYVSSDLHKSKYFGDLYKVVRNKRGCNFENWAHYDDSKINVETAKAFGISPVFIKNPQTPQIFSHLFKDKRNELEVSYQALLGTSKLANITNKNNDDLFSFGTFYMGPILYQYTKWVLNQAIERNINHLYFVARDSYLIKLIADKIIENRNLNIHTHYIYGSRQVWRIPTIENIRDYIDIMLKEYSDRLSLDFIAKRMEVDSEYFKQFVKVKSVNQILNLKQINKLKANLLNCDDFKTLILKKWQNKKELLIKYLKQEIDFSKKDFAFVEINGSGRTQDYLQEITNEFYSNKLLTFYYHLTADFDSSSKKASIKVPFCPIQQFDTYYLEIFCSSFDGRTINYTEDNDIISPVFEKAENTELKQFGYQRCIDGCLTYTNKLLEFENLNKIETLSIDLYLKYYLFLTNYLDKNTANILGEFPFMEMGSEKTIKECAAKYSLKDLMMYIFTHKQKGYATDYISCTRSSKLTRKIVKFVKKHGSLKDWIRTNPIFSVNNEGPEHCRKVFRILGAKISFNKTKPSFLQDIKFIFTLLKFLLKKKPKEKIQKVERIKFITFREPLVNGGGGGQSAAQSMNKAILDHEFNGIPIDFIFEVPNKFSRRRNIGPNIEFQSMKFVEDETKYDKNTLYVTHEEATAFGLWLMGKNYIMFSHIQGARVEEHLNFGYKLSKISQKIIKFCEAIAMKNAYSVSFVSNGAYEYFCNSKYKDIHKKDFVKGPTIYNTLYAKNELEQYQDLKYDPEYLTILSSGSLTVAKGVDRTLELVETILKKTTRKIRHIFIGEGVKQYLVESKLAEFAEKYPNFSYIRVDRCSDGNMPYLQSICDVFIVLHRIAIFDLATLEIMNQSKAIVLSNVGGNPEFNKEDNIIMWNEKTQNYDEVADLILNTDLKALGKKNKEVYEKYFGAVPYRKAYEELLADFVSNLGKRK